MKNSIRNSTLAVFIAISNQVFATDAPHYATGREYLERTEHQQHAYVLGLLDGIFLAHATSYRDGGLSIVPRLNTCLSRISSKQITAIATKHLNNTPEKWHRAASENITEGLILFCAEESAREAEKLNLLLQQELEKTNQELKAPPSNP